MTSLCSIDKICRLVKLWQSMLNIFLLMYHLSKILINIIYANNLSINSLDGNKLKDSRKVQWLPKCSVYPYVVDSCLVLYRQSIVWSICTTADIRRVGRTNGRMECAYCSSDWFHMPAAGSYISNIYGYTCIQAVMCLVNTFIYIVNFTSTSIYICKFSLY